MDNRFWDLSPTGSHLTIDRAPQVGVLHSYVDMSQVYERWMAKRDRAD
jgi:hypothetical protein